MLYIQNYTKFDLDKSSESIYRYYNGQFAELNANIDDIRAYLENMLVEIADLRVDLQETKNTIQESLDKTNDAYSKSGLTNPALAKVQEILDKAEEDLNNLEENINNTIESIDCEQQTECTFTPDCAEVINDCGENSDTPIYVTPEIERCEFNEFGCNYCDFSAGGGSFDCDVCRWSIPGMESGTLIDVNCMNYADTGGGINPICGEAGKPCSYAIESRESCENPTGCEFGVDYNCNEIVCTAGLDDTEYGRTIPDDCRFACNVVSECQEQHIPSECDFKDYSNTVCNYDSNNCNYNNPYCGEANCIAGNDNSCAFIAGGCSYDSDSGCKYDSDSGFNFDCSNFLSEEEANCNNYCSYDSDCGEGGCDYDPATDGVVCEGGDNYDPSCDELNDDDDDDDDDNVICTYIIERLFKSDLLHYYKQISRENIILGFKGGLNKKILREYKYGLGPIIIDNLREENNLYINYLWNNKVIPIWIELRRDPRVGYKKYIAFVIEMIDRYKINIDNFPILNNLYYEER